MHRVPIEVPIDAKLDAVIDKAHVDYHQSGQDGYAEASGFYSKFWGQNTYNIGYFLNGVMTNDPANVTEIATNDEVDAFIYGDYKTDKYSKFDKRTATVTTGENMELCLQGHGIFKTEFENIKDAVLLLDNGNLGLNWDDSKCLVTDDNGSVSLSFSKPGNYWISAKMADDASFEITAPICEVTVTGEELTVEQKNTKAQADLDSIVLDGIDGGIVSASKTAIKLLNIGNVNSSKITWESSNESVITSTGDITRTLDVGNVTLTATADYWGTNVTKQFVLQVPAISKEEINGMLDLIEGAFTTDSLNPEEFSGVGYGGYYSKNDSEQVDTNILIKAQKLADTKTIGSTITLSSSNAAIINDGSITYGNEVNTGEVEFSIDLLGNIRKKILNIDVPKHAITKTEVLQGDWLTFGAISLDNTTSSAVKTNLSLPEQDGEGYYTEIEWSSSNNDVINVSSYASSHKFTGEVIRPINGESDAEVTLTAKIKPGSYWDYGMAPAGPMPTPEYREKTFVVTVPSVTIEEQGEAQQLVNEGIELFNFDDITIRGTEEKATLSALTYAFNDVPYNWNYVDDSEEFRNDFRVIDVNWASENPGIGEVSNGANVTRAAIDQSGDIVLTLSYNGASAVKRFPAIVKAFTQDDIDAENAVLQEVAGLLNFDIIRGNNILSKEVTEKLVKKKSAVKNGEGISFENSSKYHNDGANISWNIDKTNVINSYFKITRQEENTEVILTATLTSPKFAYVEGVLPVQKTIKVTVLGTGEKTLIQGIAENYSSKDDAWWNSTGSWWHAVGMNAYKEVTGDNTNVISDTTKQVFVNKTIAELAELDMTATNANANSNKLQAAINGMSAFGYDSTALWTVNRTKIDAIEKLKGINIEDAKKGWYSTIAPYVITAYNQGEFDTATQEDAYINYLIGELDNVDWSWGVDTPAMIVQGLVPYYNRENVKTVVDPVITSFSAIQGVNGSFGNSNADAMVIVCLAQLGINPHTDTRFIKDGHSVLEGLMLYKTSENNGFGWDNTTYNENSTKQNFIALIAAQKVMNTGQAYNPYVFANVNKESAYANGEGNNEQEPLPPAGGDKDINVTFTLKNDSGNSWISKTTVILKENAKVYHAFTKVLDDKNFDYVGANSNYVSSITNPDGTNLAQFSKGEKSGWLYMVNGKLPNIGLKDYELSNGDDILCYFTTDWTKDPDVIEVIHSSGGSGTTVTTPPVNNVTGSTTVEATTDKSGNASVKVSEKEVLTAIDNAIKEGAQAENKVSAKEVVIVVKADSEAIAVETTIPKASITELNKKVEMVTVKTPLANISLDSATLSDIARNISGDVKVTATKVDVEKTIMLNDKLNVEQKEALKKEIGTRPVFDFNISAGDKKVSNFAGKVLVSVPYTLAKIEDPNNVVIYYVKNDGSIEMVRDCVYDEKTKTVKFATSHFSNYAVGYKEVNFADTKKHWAKDQIAFLAARNIVKGKTNSSFEPNSSITRAEFTQILANMSGADLNNYSVSNFNDVKVNAWYAKSAAWAEKTGVTKGTKNVDGTVNFNPSTKISRQDMAVMLNRYMKNIEKKALSETTKEMKFTDKEQIRNYAKEAVTTMQKAGIINGVKNSDGTYRFVPKNNATRAEASKMISIFIQSNI